MREIVVDTETTGLDPAAGHRIVEIGCVELLNHLPTGRTFQCYLNPERSMPTDAFGVHGLSAAFLADKPRFPEIADGLLQFLADSPLVIHNAAFDLGFLNAELRRSARDEIAGERTIDTVRMARCKYPGAPASLDALCRRYQIDLSDRVIHGALKDAQLLARVYLELQGGRQPGLSLVSTSTRRLPGIEPGGMGGEDGVSDRRGGGRAPRLHRRHAGPALAQADRSRRGRDERAGRRWADGAPSGSGRFGPAGQAIIEGLGGAVLVPAAGRAPRNRPAPASAAESRRSASSMPVSAGRTERAFADIRSGAPDGHPAAGH